MDLPQASVASTALAQPTRARIFEVLVERRCGVSIEALADLLALHPSAVRQHLDRLLAAGLVERTPISAGRGRPHFEWSVAPDAEPGDSPPTAYSDLSAWLTELTGSGAPAIRKAERTGRRIGRKIAPRQADTPPAEAFQTTMAALGFSPRPGHHRGTRLTYRLENCPYRKAVEQNPEVVCALHRGITEGLLDVLAPQAELTAFQPKDPCSAGCLVEIGGLHQT
jgi:predicted ArsR family transcriptional regulator